MSPTVAVLLPCHNEARFVPSLLDSLLPQVESQPGWQVVAVDDASTDATGTRLDRAAATNPKMAVIHGRFGSPGGARTAAASSLTVLAPPSAHHTMPGWLLTTDADVELPDDFVAGWAARLAELDGDEGVGAVNGGEAQGHHFDGLPNAAAASGAFGRAAARAEAAVGVVNLNGVNHAVRTAAYLTAGPYLQPTALGPHGEVNLAGEDWDLGVRLRLAGWRIEECPVTVRDRGRRLLADVHAYLSGEAYEGAFTRIEAVGPPTDLSPETATEVADATVDRVLVHFFFKIILAQPALLDRPLGLEPATVEAMRAWIARWPWPSFEASRAGFVYGRLPRFAAAFTADVRRQLDL
ncbi:MAG: glycosyltransferase family 2 protein [Acidimicrobiia bacterium]|nr:glycosyltransferase family 2 protein [Acidimicrobiia bacterium]MDH5289584.1 glycosyltransferase family 2 protein [Acidimicrobiia bacterium]